MRFWAYVRPGWIGPFKTEAEALALSPRVLRTDPAQPAAFIRD